MRRKVIIGIIVVVLLAVGLIFYQQTAVKRLDVQFESIRVISLDFSGVTLEATVALHNPSLLPATVGRVEATIHANDVALASVQSAEPFTIPRQTTHSESFVVKLDYLDIGLSLVNAIRQRDVTWHIEGTYYVDLWMGEYAHEFVVKR